MGLFGFGKKKSQEKLEAEREELLASLPPSDGPLWAGPPEKAIEFVRKKIMRPEWNDDNIKMNDEWHELTEEPWYEYFVCTNTSLYKTHEGSKVRVFPAIDFLECASELGSGDAAFLAGVMHEHGMCGLDPKEGAQYKWYDIAKGRDCRLLKALEILKTDMITWPRASTDQSETLAINMWYVSMRDFPWRHKAEVCLTEEDYSLLNWVASLLVCYYCSKEHPLSMLLLLKILSNPEQKENINVRNFFTYDGGGRYIKWGGFGEPSDAAIKKKVARMESVFSERLENGDPLYAGAVEAMQK